MTFGEKLRQLMAERGTSLRKLAKEVPVDQGHLSRIANDHRAPSVDLAQRLDKLLHAGGELAALKPSSPLTATDRDLIDMMQRAEASDLGPAALEMIDVAVDRLCRDYPSVSPDQLCMRGKTHMERLLRLLDGRTTLAEHRELLVRTGWLAALLACAFYDDGEQAAAEMARRMARRMGEQAGHGELIGWSWEIAAWFALVERRYDDVVAYSEAGVRHAGVSNAAVQLTLQAGRGYARMGDQRAAEALRVGRKILDQLPRPDHPEHHFVFDHDKYEFYCSTIYTMLGQDDAAREHANEVITQCRQSDGSVRWPMRYAMANLDLALVAGRHGQLDGALTYGRAALAPARRSGDLLPRAAELHGLLAERFAGEAAVAEFAEQLHHERRALPPGG
ncbi:helix-turn-helix transcriptional regulator [Actinomadura fulvescens]|uniref:HTH cro/C1-type domain-containing protein n=1 Tax=Actinomadura fulvescens TaxID=46160 RepID=A0ABN3QW20_9ACTN